MANILSGMVFEVTSKIAVEFVADLKKLSVDGYFSYPSVAINNVAHYIEVYHVDSSVEIMLQLRYGEYLLRRF